MSDDDTPWVDSYADDGEHRRTIERLRGVQAEHYIGLIEYMRGQITESVEWAIENAPTPGEWPGMVKFLMESTYANVRAFPIPSADGVIDLLRRDVDSAILGEAFRPLDPIRIRELCVGSTGPDPELN